MEHRIRANLARLPPRTHQERVAGVPGGDDNKALRSSTCCGAWWATKRFSRGLRAFDAEHRDRKAGTDDLRKAMEAASGLPLERFFERWVLDTALPRVRITTATKSDGGKWLTSSSARCSTSRAPSPCSTRMAPAKTLVVLSEAAGGKTLPLKSALRSVDVNRDDAALGTFERR